MISKPQRHKAHGSVRNGNESDTTYKDMKKTVWTLSACALASLAMIRLKSATAKIKKLTTSTDTGMFV